MKTPCLTAVLILLTAIAFAQEVPNIPEPTKDSSTVALEKQNTMIFVEQQAVFPGGELGFYKFIGKILKKPELVGLLGFKGRIVMGFTIDKQGPVKDIHAFSDSGTGYEQEFTAAISKSPRWKSAIQNGQLAEQKFTLPFTIDQPRAEIEMHDLKRSSYKFTFQIKGKIYDIKQAEALLGSKFSSAKIDYIKTFAEQPEENKKQKAYLIQIID
jgi:protein TonB